jgi:GNAT superfamily N-acetyltransferase
VLTCRLRAQIRPLASSDYARGHLDILRVLTVAPDVGERAWAAQFAAMRATPNTYYGLVIVDRARDAVVAVGSVFVERKFLRGLGSVGHIEDIAVDKAQQGKKLGLRVIQALTGISERAGCYKTILNCSTDNIRASRDPAPDSRADGATQRSTRSAGSCRRRTRWCAARAPSAPALTPSQAKYAPEPVQGPSKL